jgi:hypothetical protein
MPVPTHLDYRADFPNPVHVTIPAIELKTLASHHSDLATDSHRAGNQMEARVTELRRLATRARGA